MLNPRLIAKRLEVAVYVFSTIIRVQNRNSLASSVFNAILEYDEILVCLVFSRLEEYFHISRVAVNECLDILLAAYGRHVKVYPITEYNLCSSFTSVNRSIVWIPTLFTEFASFAKSKRIFALWHTSDTLNPDHTTYYVFSRMT